MRLGLLDFCSVPPRMAAADVLVHTLETAVRADALGFSRYWLAEHHLGALAQSSPATLLPVLAGLTSSLRVGTAAVLLQLHSPFAVAEQFRLLEALFPGRIDLGVGAGLADATVVTALRGGPAQPEQYAPRVRELAAYVRGTSELALAPAGEHAPSLWVMGASGPRGAMLAGELGASYGLSLFHATSNDDPAILAAYRDSFVSRDGGAPSANIAVGGVCVEREAEVAEARARAPYSGFIRPTVFGTPAQVVEQLQQAAARHGVDEVVFFDVSIDPLARRRSCELLAEAAHLTPPDPDDD